MGNKLPLLPPIEMSMPALGQSWMFYINLGIVLLFLIWALHYWRNRGSPIGVLFLLGGALTALNEPIVDELGKCWWPADNEWVLIRAFGVAVPMFAVPVYAWFMGGQAFLSYQIYRKGVSTRGLFWMYFAGVIVNNLLEEPAMYFGLYSYYGEQPFVLSRLPLWWPCVNALMPMVMAAGVLRFEHALPGLRKLLIIPMCWMLGAATNGLVGAPTWVALHTEGVTSLVTHAAALVTLGMGLLVCYGLGLLVASDAPPKIVGANVGVGATRASAGKA